MLLILNYYIVLILLLIDLITIGLFEFTDCRYLLDFRNSRLKKHVFFQRVQCRVNKILNVMLLFNLTAPSQIGIIYFIF